MEGEQLPPHGSVGKAELDVTLDAAQQGLVVTAEQVRGHDHHAIEAVEFLHQGVAVLVDRGGAGFIKAHPFGKQAVGLVEKENRAVMGRPLERLLDVLGRVAQVFRDHGAVVHLVEQLAKPERGTQGGAGLPGAGRAVKVEDAAAPLRLETADAPDLLELVADADGAQAVEDLLLHAAMEDQAGEVVAGFGVDENSDLRFLFALPLPVAAARVAVVGGDGRVRRQFTEFLDGWLRHGCEG